MLLNIIKSRILIVNVSKKELYELIEKIPENQVELAFLYLKDLVKKTVKKDYDPEKYWGIMDLTLDTIEEDCKKLREEWDRTF